jgi:3-oxoacyl-[acyl-carrier protein] reductase
MTADTPSVYKKQMIAQIPQMRIGFPTDVAKVAVFLASENSDYITGGLLSGILKSTYFFKLINCK